MINHKSRVENQPKFWFDTVAMQWQCAASDEDGQNEDDPIWWWFHDVFFQYAANPFSQGPERKRKDDDEGHHGVGVYGKLVAASLSDVFYSFYSSFRSYKPWSICSISFIYIMYLLKTPIYRIIDFWESRIFASTSCTPLNNLSNKYDAFWFRMNFGQLMRVSVIVLLSTSPSIYYTNMRGADASANPLYLLYSLSHYTRNPFPSFAITLLSMHRHCKRP